MTRPDTRPDIASITELHHFDDIIDVRTPLEFAEDHIPGALNCPVLSNEERVHVGTLYKQVSPFAAKKIGAAYVAANIAKHLHTHFMERPKHWRPLILCWRGGERSASMTHIFRRIGWPAKQLEGGYKAYRRWVISALDQYASTIQPIMLCGMTGSGKSRILQTLATRGAQILDLEEMAHHKGSVLGHLPDSLGQPSQKMFDSRLCKALSMLDPKAPVYIEAESRKIGNVALPSALIAAMQAAPYITIEASLNARIDFLLEDYAYALERPDWLIRRLDVLIPHVGREEIKRWQAWVNEGAWRALIQALLEKHYDPLYQRAGRQHCLANPPAKTLQTDSLSDERIRALAKTILKENGVDEINTHL